MIFVRDDRFVYLYSIIDCKDRYCVRISYKRERLDIYLHDVWVLRKGNGIKGTRYYNVSWVDRKARTAAEEKNKIGNPDITASRIDKRDAKNRIDRSEFCAGDIVQ